MSISFVKLVEIMKLWKANGFWKPCWNHEIMKGQWILFMEEMKYFYNLHFMYICTVCQMVVYKIYQLCEHFQAAFSNQDWNDGINFCLFLGVSMMWDCVVKGKEVCFWKQCEKGIFPIHNKGIVFDWLIVLGYNITLKAEVMSWRSVTFMCFIAFLH